METGIEKAVRLCGSQTALATKIGVSPQAVQKWVVQGKPPLNRCKAIEEAMDGEVTRSELDPEAFGAMPQQPDEKTFVPRSASDRRQHERRDGERRRSTDKETQR